jgi:hypothetical protein
VDCTAATWIWLCSAASAAIKLVSMSLVLVVSGPAFLQADKVKAQHIKRALMARMQEFFFIGCIKA